MATLPKNPTVEQYQEYYDSLPPEQQAQFRKAGILRLINTVYTDGAEEMEEDDEPEDGATISGTFTDRREGGNDRVFRFRLIGDELVYEPVDREKLMAEQGGEDD